MGLLRGMSKTNNKNEDMLRTLSLVGSGPERKTNYACALTGPGTIEMRDMEMPVCGVDEVLVRVEATGICGSDVNFYKNARIGPYGLDPNSPLVLGHESAGTVIEMGANARTLNPRVNVGDRVAIEPGRACRRCIYCKRGELNLCDRLRYCGVPPTHGTLSQYYATDADVVVKLPEGVSWLEAGCIQPMAIALHIVERAQLRAGHSLAVVGCGPLGLLVMAIARAFGVTRIAAIDRTADRAHFAHTYAHATPFVLDDDFQAQHAVAQLELPSDGFDVVVEASGTEKALSAAVDLTRKAGTYVQAGLGKPTAAFPIILVATKELRILGSMRYRAGDFERALELVSNRLVDLSPLIARTFPLNRIEDAFSASSGGKVGKVVILNQKMA